MHTLTLLHQLGSEERTQNVTDNPETSFNMGDGHRYSLRSKRQPTLFLFIVFCSNGQPINAVKLQFSNQQFCFCYKVWMEKLDICPIITPQVTLLALTLRVPSAVLAVIQTKLDRPKLSFPFLHWRWEINIVLWRIVTRLPPSISSIVFNLTSFGNQLKRALLDFFSC